MNKSKGGIRFILKILAGLTALTLIGGILFVTNSFVGNPISSYLADRAIKEYVDRNYSYLDLEVEKSVYNFKDGAYMGRARSKTSIDTHFAVYYKNGKVQRDDYDTYVLGMFNTIERLSQEYSSAAKGIVARELGYDNNTTMVMYNKDGYESAGENLELDMKFSKDLPLDAEVTLRLDLKDISLEGIAKVINDAHGAFLDNGCNFDTYGLYAENDGVMVMVHGIIPEDIEGGSLLSLLQDAKENEGGRISVFIKGEEK